MPKRVHITLRYTADFDDDFDTSALQDVDKLVGHGVVALLRKEPEQGVNISNVKLDLAFPNARKTKKKGGGPWETR